MPVAIKTSETLFDAATASAYLGLAEETVSKYIQRGLIKPFRRVGRSYLIAESELARYQREKRPPGNPAFSK